MNNNQTGDYGDGSSQADPTFENEDGEPLDDPANPFFNGENAGYGDLGE